MGAWGVNLYQDDVTLDVKGEFLVCIGRYTMELQKRKFQDIENINVHGK